jgi:dienelactone hydrolase
MKLLQKWILGLFVLLGACAHAQTLLKIDNQGTRLDGYFFAAQAADARKAPAIVALHGCGGMLEKKGLPNLRTKNYAQLLNEQGWHVLFVDSLTARGVKSVCGGNSQVTQAQRVTDVQMAVAFLAKREDVDDSRIGVLGWSHGGSTALLSSDASVDYAVTPRAVVAFYPGCGEAKGKRMTWHPARPVLMQLGAADDWTSPIPCQSLAAQGKDLVHQDTYANANHGFDSKGSGAVRAIQLNTPRGNKTVHTGGDPAAKAASQAKLIAFFKDHFK